MQEVIALYNRLAPFYDRVRSRSLMEAPYLDRVLARIPTGARILDIGCGAGEPITRYLIEAGCCLTGVDAAPEMLRRCRERFAGHTFIEADMRTLELGRPFDAVIAWDSFFHLRRTSQREMFARFAQHLRPGGVLLFTSGTVNDIRIGRLCGEPLFHASLDSEEYAGLLKAHGLAVLDHVVEDPKCGGHTIWLAQKDPEHSLATTVLPTR
ncbi:MAG: class I SAM-dependent methyltransferase [Nannocystaceae bacterium]